jgi:membrane-bound lytic murein transglycosylase MltF
VIASVLLLLTSASALGQAVTAPKGDRTALPLPAEQWMGDLDQMITRRFVRVLVAHSKTFFFVDKGTPRGASHDVMRAFEEELNKKLKRAHLRVHVMFIPVARDRLLPGLIDGRGDIAAANLTITPAREAHVDFADPWITGVSEIIVTGPASPRIGSLNDLAGQEVFVRRTSSYHESLVGLNARFRRAGLREIVLVPAPENLEDEDLLEMLSAGLVRILVVDSHKATFWKKIFTTLTLHPELAVRTGGDIAWAIRKGSPKLKTALNEFVKTHGEKTVFGRLTLQRYLEKVRGT